MEARKILGLNLKRLRVEQGMTQERLALEAVIDRAYVGRIERGEENVTIDRIDALALVLKVPVSALLEAPARKTPVAGLRAGRKPNSATKPRAK